MSVNWMNSRIDLRTTYDFPLSLLEYWLFYNLYFVQEMNDNVAQANDQKSVQVNQIALNQCCFIPFIHSQTKPFKTQNILFIKTQLMSNVR